MGTDVIPDDDPTKLAGGVVADALRIALGLSPINKLEPWCDERGCAVMKPMEPYKLWLARAARCRPQRPRAYVNTAAVVV